MLSHPDLNDKFHPLNRNQMKAKLLAAAVVLASLSTGCSRHSGWSVDGIVEGLPKGGRIALEAFNNGIWYVVDSLDVNSKGYFSYESPVPAKYPEIMRLTLPSGGSVHFPVDSVDNITVRATAAGFAHDAVLSGTPEAVRMRQVDSIIAEAQARLGNQAVLTDRDTKRALSRYILGDSSTVVAYYVLNKSVAGKPLFNPSESFDNRIYGAVAQNYETYRPEDPRGAVIRKYYFEGRKALGLLPGPEASTTLEVPVSGLIDITRYDNKGVSHSLADVASKKGVTLLSFTTYGADFSPAYNVILNGIYTKYRDNGLEIYQLSVDSDEGLWKQSAVNLPWITVWNSTTDGPSVLYSYNVSTLPLTYIIGRDGEICARVEDPTKLESELKKFL